MKKIFLIFAWALILFVLQTHLTQAARIEVLENWSDDDEDGLELLSVSGHTFAEIYHMPGQIYNAEYWAVSGNAYASASADSLGDDFWYDATAWCEGTGDSGTGNVCEC